MVVTKPETDEKPEDTMIAEKLTEGITKISMLIQMFKAVLMFNTQSETTIKSISYLFVRSVSKTNCKTSLKHIEKMGPKIMDCPP